MKVAILKYNSGNTCSVSFALERIGINAVITENVDEILSADKIIFPGVGEASSAMQYLKDRKLDKIIMNLQQPVLGICLGMQLMCADSEEGNTECLGIFNTQVKKIPKQKSTIVKVPHTGWNEIQNLSSELFNTISENSHLYFVHSYYAELSENTVAVTNYGIKISAALQKNNFYGTQFHPEKSGEIGSRILENFIQLKI